MYYLDSQRTVTRRDSSLITTGRRNLGDDRSDYETASTARGHSTARLLPATESISSFLPRPKGSVRKEIVTLLFESMLDYIVDSWEVIETQRPEEHDEDVKTTSDITIWGKKKKPVNVEKEKKTSKAKPRNRFTIEIGDTQSDNSMPCWWNQPDEKSVIRFKNGNVYEGNISMKRMNGEGRFQWADGTAFMGNFKDNEIVGKGTLKWKDDTWYTGDFAGNLRHGKGLYVDSRRQRYYVGQWHCGTKHGHGIICYSNLNKSTYDGEWAFNVRHGHGKREYCSKCGYQGEWDHYVREGKGLMVWPNHDYYKGEWKNGTMSGYGIYIWNTVYNKSLSLPSINVYRGCWVRGKRTGYGILNFGFSLGSHYKGEFKENKKHGMGKIVTNNGFILKHKTLFFEDCIKPTVLEECCDPLQLCNIKYMSQNNKEPIKFDVCDSNVGLRYHILEAFNRLDRGVEIRMSIINDYIENNRSYLSNLGSFYNTIEKISDGISEEMVNFEENALWNAVRSYEKELNDIYYKYATICNNEPIHFIPILIRLYMWQFYYDCDMHEKGLTLVKIDEILAQNRRWLVKTPHGPFEKIYLWQFINGLIVIASQLYSKMCLPGPRPDTIVANAFRCFMDNDALPNSGRCKGYLPQQFSSFVPLRGLYHLYRTLGEPHTLRKFLCAVNRSPHLGVQLELVEAPIEDLPYGRNTYLIGDEIAFVRDPSKNFWMERPENNFEEARKDMELFNFGNLSSETVIKQFAHIFPDVYQNEILLNLEIEMTFFEFFQVFIACTEESIRVKEEEIRWREAFDTSLHVKK